MVGDLKFFSQMLGKEGFNSNWGSHCQLNRNEWAVGCEFTIVESTLESIRLLAAESTDATGVDRKGVREDPYFNIPVANYIWPILHIKLGHGNAIVKFLLDYADKAVQQVPQEQILLREQVMELNGKLADAGDLRNQWDSDGVESGKEIVKRLRAELKGIPNKTKPAAAGSEQKKLEDEIQTHLNDRAVIMASLKAMRSSRKIKKDKLDGFKSARKTDKDSLLTGIDAILQGYGIKRQAYHGGDLVGGHIGILMERAEDIMNDVETYLIDSKKNLVNNPTNQVPASDEDIRSMCESIKHLLVLWDMILSLLVHTEYPSDEDCNRTQDFIDAAISIGDKLGMSRTIKIHGCMSHIVSQMRRIPCGLSDFDENTRILWSNTTRKVLDMMSVLNT